MENNYTKLAAIDVGKQIEKKNGLSYLSWAWAVDQLLRQDPAATWEYRPFEKFGDTVMVFCTVTAFGKPMTAQLPVMNHRNQAIANPDSFAVNTAMQRCLAKAIALHGLGLYIYAGEDLPYDAGEDLPYDAGEDLPYDDKQDEFNVDDLVAKIKACSDLPRLKDIYSEAVVSCKGDKGLIAEVVKAKDIRKKELASGTV